MKMFLIAVFVILAAYIYGWRFHPEAIGSKDRRPVFTHSSRDNKIAKWHPSELLDSVNGNREYNREQARIEADRAAFAEKTKKD